MTPRVGAEAAVRRSASSGAAGLVQGVALYFWVGGLAGASAPLALVAGLRGAEQLARRAQAVALAGAVISPGVLIKDLGRPKRFLNMLRVFKVTSPMSVGSWILSAFGAAVTAGAARELLGRIPRLDRAGQVATLALGPGLSTYTSRSSSPRARWPAPVGRAWR